MKKQICTLGVLTLFCLCSCNQLEIYRDEQNRVETWTVRSAESIKAALQFVLANNGRLNDSSIIVHDSLVNQLYDKNRFKPVWSRAGKWQPWGDSLFSFLKNARDYGLFPNDYHYRALKGIHLESLRDSSGLTNMQMLAESELLLTDAFLQLAKDLAWGRLPADSTATLPSANDSMHFYTKIWEDFRLSGDVIGVFHALEPDHPGYNSLKDALKKFVDSTGVFKRYTWVPYTVKDSSAFNRILQRRLFEEDILPDISDTLSRADLAEAMGRYQQKAGLKQSGKINSATINSLNNTAWVKFKMAAVTLDRYKQLPHPMPGTYVWVNIPSYTLQVIESGKIILQSKTIVGKPKTKTPSLTSVISDVTLFPQWNIPRSIVGESVIPGMRKDVDYLARRKMIIVDDGNNIVHPDSIDWSKYNMNNFPFRVKQAQGYSNALGLIKLNFSNAFDVYLHDTPGRWLFNSSYRALSHGCIRVEQIQQLTDFLLSRDTTRTGEESTKKLLNRGYQQIIRGFPKIPLYMRYFLCEGEKGNLVVHDDIYGEYKNLVEHFNNKSVQ
jgi:L,D-transpeptidase YcbB